MVAPSPIITSTSLLILSAPFHTVAAAVVSTRLLCVEKGTMEGLEAGRQARIVASTQKVKESCINCRSQLAAAIARTAVVGQGAFQIGLELSSPPPHQNQLQGGMDECTPPDGLSKLLFALSSRTAASLRNSTTTVGAKRDSQ